MNQGGNKSERPRGHRPDEESEISRRREELYKKEEAPEIKRRRLELSRLGVGRPVSKQSAIKQSGQTPQFVDVMRARQKRRRKILLWGSGAAAIVILLAAVIAATVWYRISRQVQPEHIELSVQAPAEHTSGEDITYVVQYRNASRVSWQSVEMTLDVPKGFQLKDSQPAIEPAGRQFSVPIGHVAAGQTGEVTVRGRLIGEQNAVAVIQAELIITPENFPSGRFSQVAVFNTTITALPVEVSIESSADAAHGERLAAIVRVRNTGTQIIDNAYLRLDPTPGMRLATEDEEFSEGFSVVDSGWELPSIEPLQEIERRAVVYVEGQPGERRSLLVEAGIREGEERYVQRTVTHVVTVSASELFVQQTMNGSDQPIVVTPGAEVEAVVTYKNIGTVGLKNVIVEAIFEGAGLDPSTLQLENGAYNPTTRSISWSSATVPELATVQPQQEGQLTYEFKIQPLEDFPTQGETISRFTLVSTAAIDSTDLPTPLGQPRKVVSDRAVISIGTSLTLAADSFYDDGRLGISSTGPLPPRVGNETTYTVRLRLGSTLNDVGDVRLVAVLPDGVRYTGKTYMTGGTLEFDDRSGQVVWSIPIVPALTGRSSPPQELHFQVAIVPGENQRGEVIAFLNQLTVEGTDQFTEQNVQRTVTEYPTTETGAPTQGKVE